VPPGWGSSDSDPRTLGGDAGTLGPDHPAAGGGGSGAGPGASEDPGNDPAEGATPGATGADSGTSGGSADAGGVIASRRTPQGSSGSVPLTKAIVTTLTHSLDGSRSTGAIATRSGTGKSSLGSLPTTFCMYEVQMGTATREPVSSRPRLRGRS
jgi:hypothetical protein